MLDIILTGRRSAVAGSGRLLLPPIILGLVLMTVTMAVSVEEEMDSDEIMLEEEEEDSVSTEVPGPLSPDSRVSPLSSWLIFRRNSNKGENRRTKGPKKTSKHGLPGPPGPPGPRGPPGPPGPQQETQQQTEDKQQQQDKHEKQQQLIQELQLSLRDLASGVCVQCDGPQKVSTSFLTRLSQTVSVPRRTLLELQPFRQPSDSEQRFQRGRGFNSSSGRYTAALSGFYQLNANLMIECGDRVQVRLRDSVRAAICIESLCQSNLSVESVTGVAVAGGTFSILLTGILYLQAGEYVSVFVDNASGSSVNILQDSLFNGILMGV